MKWLRKFYVMYILSRFKKIEKKRKESLLRVIQLVSWGQRPEGRLPQQWDTSQNVPTGSFLVLASGLLLQNLTALRPVRQAVPGGPGPQGNRKPRLDSVSGLGDDCTMFCPLHFF